ncbi:hypothetical protein, partial [Escherichia coli]|uniref:hypothetical protein n=1 Tax=Escherichia coli TaxID=562 RepID=UPI003F48615E
FTGSGTGGSPQQTITASRDSDGAWATEPNALADGTYTVPAEQVDGDRTVGVSAPSTFTVATPAQAAPRAWPP